MLFTPRVEEVMRNAVMKSVYMQNEYVTPEHILFGMSADTIFARCFEDLGGEIDTLREDLDAYFIESLPHKEIRTGEEAQVSVGIERVIEGAAQASHNSGHDAIDLHHMLWAIFKLKDCFAVYFIEKQIGDKEEILYRIQEAIDSDGDEETREDAWKKYATCLNETVAKHNPLIGRAEELERTLQILCRKEKNNPLFLGEAGVGKTSMAYGLAEKIVKGEVPEALKDAKIYLLDVASLIAGTQYRGELEKRMKSVMECFVGMENAILFIDEIHTLLGAGSLGGGSMDVSDILKPYFESGEIRFVGATSYSAYKKSFGNNNALSRRFQTVEIKEPSSEEAVQILKGIKKSYEKFHGVRYASGVIEAAVELTSRLVHGKFLPDKAIDLLDEAGAYRKLHPQEDKKVPVVDKETLEEVLTKACGIPASQAKGSEIDRLSKLEEKITSQIFGQEEAVRKLVEAISMSRAGLLEEHKPIAGLLFVGPTGVGKTEVAKVLAKEMAMPLVRFDMSEYAEKHTVAKLIGSPAGYVGYEEGGLLTEAVQKEPYCVLLLDEIEKAHQDIYNVLLQVLDYASLTDNKGRKTDFSNVIIIMTSNAGARELGKSAMGFGGENVNMGAMMEEVKRVFSPEFRNRLSGIVEFHPMSEKMAELIARKKLRSLSEKLLLKKVKLQVSDEAFRYVLKEGITREYGARQLERVVDTQIKPLFVNELLYGKLVKGGNVTLDVKEGKPCLRFERTSTAKKKAVQEKSSKKQPLPKMPAILTVAPSVPSGTSSARRTK
ncbi:MAG: AAA family ATPase [Lachnospiraceae bacterium]|nr:AAA family ATPase [Lachnospiraceae bacterium]